MSVESAKRILVVDDEPQILRALRKSLTINQFDVRTASDGEAALDLFRDWSPDLIITDLTMPLMNGLELCREVRRFSQIPIIVLSVKGEEKIKIEALDIGADDYITKPFSIDELLARIRAALRRAPSGAAAIETKIETGDFSIDLDARQVYVRGAEVHLTPKEFELLIYLIKNQGRIVTHRTLLDAVWGGNSTEQNEYLRVFIGQLRKKIEPNPSKPRYILTDPWVGYRFNP
ncbi:MAG TPA: response regulator transcription factor [Pyrinomonadaceae bacterium]|jgi:two-component system KDP operon response regulator KdpE